MTDISAATDTTAAHAPARRDWLWLAGAAAIAIVLAAMPRIVSPLNQPFPEFLATNRGPLIAVGAALALAWVATLSAAAGRHRGFAMPAAKASRRTRPRALRTAGGAAILLAGLACFGYAAWHAIKPRTGIHALAVWAAGVPLLVCGCALLEARRARGWWRDAGLGLGDGGRRWWQRDAVLVALFLAAWTGLSAWRLETRPGFFHGDEAMVAMYGRATYIFDEGKGRNAPWNSLYLPFASGVPRALALDALPDHPVLGARIPALVASAAALGVLFALVRAHLGRLAAWLALVLTAFHHLFIHFARQGLPQPDAVLAVAVWMLAWLAGWRSRRASFGMLAGCMAGFSYYTYQGAKIILPVTAALLALQLLQRPLSLAARWRMLAGFALAAALVAAPIHLHHRKSGLLAYRSNAVFLLAQRNLEVMFRSTGTETVPQLMLVSSWPAVGGVLLWPDTSSNYASRALPMTERAATGLGLVGAAMALGLMRRRRIAAMLLLQVSGVVVFASLLTVSPPPPYAPRMYMAVPFAMVLAALPLAEVVRRIRGAFGPAPAHLAAAVAFGIVGVIAGRNAKAYYRTYLDDMANPGYRSVPMGLSLWLHRNMARDRHLFIAAQDTLQVWTSSMKVWDRGYTSAPIRDANAPLPPPDAKAAATVYAIQLPQFAAVAKAVAAQHPEAERIEIRDPFLDGAPITHVVFVVPRGS